MTATPIVQFGTSRFLQAHADLMIGEALERGEAAGAICVVQSSGDPARSQRLAALTAEGGYPVRIRGREDGKEIDTTKWVSSVRRTLSTAAHWNDLQQLFEGEARYVLSNTSDAGFKPSPADEGEQFDQTMSFPAKLRLLLHRRFETGAEPITIVPMELVPRNGDVLRRRILDLSAGSPSAFRDWLESQVTWANTLVDRIVSEPIDPAGAVAEPYALWAIEDQSEIELPCVHENLKVVGDLSALETLKLYILNAGHTLLAHRWRKGEAPETVREAIADPELFEWLNEIILREVVPGFGRRSTEAEKYWTVCIERFSNPFLDHLLSDIAQNHREKVLRRLKSFLDWSGAEATRIAAIVDAS